MWLHRGPSSRPPALVDTEEHVHPGRVQVTDVEGAVGGGVDDRIIEPECVHARFLLYTGQYGSTPTHSSSEPAGHGGIVTANAESGESPVARNWNEVPAGMVRQRSGSSGPPLRGRRRAATSRRGPRGCTRSPPPFDDVLPGRPRPVRAGSAPRSRRQATAAPAPAIRRARWCRGRRAGTWCRNPDFLVVWHGRERDSAIAGDAAGSQCLGLVAGHDLAGGKPAHGGDHHHTRVHDGETEAGRIRGEPDDRHPVGGQSSPPHLADDQVAGERRADDSGACDDDRGQRIRDDAAAQAEPAPPRRRLTGLSYSGRARRPFP